MCRLRLTANGHDIAPIPLVSLQKDYPTTAGSETGWVIGRGRAGGVMSNRSGSRRGEGKGVLWSGSSLSRLWLDSAVPTGPVVSRRGGTATLFSVSAVSGPVPANTGIQDIQVRAEQSTHLWLSGL